MPRLPISASFLAIMLLSIVAIAAVRSSEAGASQADVETADHPLVGSWNVVVSGVAGQPPAPALATYAADGTVLQSNRAVQPAPEGAASSLIFNSAGHGAWTPTGDRTAVATIAILRSGDDGMLLGTLTAHADIEVAEDGNSYTAESTITMTNPEGDVVQTFPITIEATRITAEPMGTPIPATPGA